MSQWDLGLNNAYCFRQCPSTACTGPNHPVYRECCFSVIELLHSFTHSSSTPHSLLSSLLRLLKKQWLLLMVYEAVVLGLFLCWLTIDELYSCVSPPPTVSKLVRSDALPAHAQMQITQQRSFISNQTKAAAEHPGSWVPAELLCLRGSD